MGGASVHDEFCSTPKDTVSPHGPLQSRDQGRWHSGVLLSQTSSLVKKGNAFS